MAGFGDTLIAFKIIKSLGTKWADFDAYKLGLIDDKGKKLKSPKTPEEKEAYSSYYKLIFNLKRILSKFVKNNSAQKLITLFLLKEGYANDITNDIVNKLNLPTDTQDINMILANTLLESVVEK